jgi:hypothetical protein
VKTAFLNDWYLANKERPGITFQTRLNAEKSLLSKVGVGENLKSLGGELKQAAGSTVGMFAMPLMINGLSAMALWHGTDSEEYKALEMASDNFFRGSKNAWRGWEANREKWFTGEGKQKFKALTTARDELLATTGDTPLDLLCSSSACARSAGPVVEGGHPRRCRRHSRTAAPGREDWRVPKPRGTMPP